MARPENGAAPLPPGTLAGGACVDLECVEEIWRPHRDSPTLPRRGLVDGVAVESAVGCGRDSKSWRLSHVDAPCVGSGGLPLPSRWIAREETKVAGRDPRKSARIVEDSGEFLILGGEFGVSRRRRRIAGACRRRALLRSADPEVVCVGLRTGSGFP